MDRKRSQWNDRLKWTEIHQDGTRWVELYENRPILNEINRDRSRSVKMHQDEGEPSPARGLYFASAMCAEVCLRCPPPSGEARPERVRKG
eukprot:1432653-Pleurochrysis_carterae.AAC.1